MEAVRISDQVVQTLSESLCGAQRKKDVIPRVLRLAFSVDVVGLFVDADVDRLELIRLGDLRAAGRCLVVVKLDGL